MALKNNPLAKFKLVYRRSNPVVKIAAVVAIVFSMLAIVTLTWVRSNVEQETEQLRQEAARLEQANNMLEAKIAILGSVQGVHQLAEEELGMLDPDAVIIDIE